MPKKNFKDNPALQFLTGTDPAAPQYPMKPNPLYIETKSRRSPLLMQPSLYNKIKSLADENGTSVNDTIHTILLSYFDRKEAKK